MPKINANNSVIAKLIRTLIPPRKANGAIRGFFQKLRRRTFRVFYESTDHYFSQAGQDKFLNETVFRGKRRGTFMEIGAADSVVNSNTYYFEKELGWTGICVEPRPDAFTKLATNRKCICLRGCVSDREGKASFLHVEDVPTLSGLLLKYDARHLERIQREAAECGSKIQQIEVRCYTFRDLACENGFNAIDYLSIDTEGGELDLLRTIDFDQIEFKVVSVENCFADGQFETVMDRKGYALVAVLGDDDIYVRRKTSAVGTEW